MKILATACWHLHDKSPIRHLKNRTLSQFDVVDEILSIYNDNNYDILVIAGDLFHKYNESAIIVNELIKKFEYYNITKDKFRIAYGNHDLEYNNFKYRLSSSMYTFCNHFNINHLIEDNIFYIDHFHFKDIKPIFEYNNQPIVISHIYHEKSNNIPFNIEGITTKEIIKKYKNAEIIITGDNHLKHTSKIGNIKVINSGQLIRYSLNELESVAFEVKLGEKGITEIPLTTQKGTLFNIQSNKLVSILAQTKTVEEQLSSKQYDKSFDTYMIEVISGDKEIETVYKRILNELKIN